MVDSSKSNKIKKIQSDYHRKMRDLEDKLAAKHKELDQVEHDINRESKKIGHTNISKLKSKKAELNVAINQLKKEIRKLNKEKMKKIRAL
jgi:uncharacterized coiled-coil DUF342 family protein